jgi:hypothetical protein
MAPTLVCCVEDRFVWLIWAVYPVAPLPPASLMEAGQKTGSETSGSLFMTAQSAVFVLVLATLSLLLAMSVFFALCYRRAVVLYRQGLAEHERIKPRARQLRWDDDFPFMGEVESALSALNYGFKRSAKFPPQLSELIEAHKHMHELSCDIENLLNDSSSAERIAQMKNKIEQLRSVKPDSPFVSHAECYLQQAQLMLLRGSAVRGKALVLVQDCIHDLDCLLSCHGNATSGVRLLRLNGAR